ncbi:choice-of-anchor D domain-containing protein [bacterium]|nr:choice-of-anchor D domain-containing protein [bacterium]
MKYILAILLPLVLFAQPQSPNFVMSSETFSALASHDSTQNYILRSAIGQLSIADTHTSANFIFTSGVLTPVFTIPAPEVSVNRDTLNYGDIWINTIATDSFTITNTGNSDLIVDSLHSDNPLLPSLTQSFTVAPSQSHTVVYQLQVPDTLSYSALLTVHCNAEEISIAIAAHGVWTELTATPQSVDMGIIAVGDSADAELTLISSGNTGLDMTNFVLTSDHFMIAQDPELTLGAYDTTSLLLRFHAVTSGVYLDTLIISSSVGGNIGIPLTAGATAINDRDAQIPTVFFMDQNYPNPFNPSTTIRFGVPRASEVSIETYDVLGRRAAVLISGRLEAGYHTVSWNCMACPSGHYIARMTSPDVTITRKLLLLK